MENLTPFETIQHSDGSVSVFLSCENYIYDWLDEIKVTPTIYGDGYCYEDAFRDYLKKNFLELNQRLRYDSENGMFCVYCNNTKDAEKVVKHLTALYNNEEKMINLIKETKIKYQYSFDIDI